MSSQKKTIVGTFWAFSHQLSAQIINFVVITILSRILDPKDFGTIAVFGVFMAISSMLIDSGLTSSLLRNQEVDQRDYSTVFYFNIIVSTIIYIILFLTAPLISKFFEIPILTPIIRIYCITLIINSFAGIQGIIFAKNFDYKTPLKIQVPSLIISGIVGIILAYKGFGVWSLVYMYIVNSIASTIQFWFYCEWKPKFIFDINAFKYHFNFGINLTFAGLLDIVVSNLYTVLIGKFYNTAQLGQYSKAGQMSSLPVTSIANPLHKITYPLFSELKEEPIRLKETYEKILRGVIFVIAPLLMIMIVVAEPLFRFLFTAKWLIAAQYFQIMCIAAVIYPINSFNLNILLAMGHSNKYFRLEVVKKILMIVILIATLPFGITIMICGQVIFNFIVLFINTHYSGKYINFSIINQFSTISKSIFTTLTMGLIIYLIYSFLHNQLSEISILIVVSAIGISLYMAIAYIFKFEEMRLMIQFSNKFLRKK